MTGPHSWTRQASSPVFAVLDGHELVVALFDSAALAREWIELQRAANDPGVQLAAKAWTVEEKQVWHVLPPE